MSPEPNDTNSPVNVAPPDVSLFTIRAISVATFLCGPLATAILAGINLRRLGQGSRGTWTIVLGALATFVFLSGLVLLPSEFVDRIPTTLLPAIYTPVLGFWVHQTQGVSIRAALEAGARKASGWVAMWIGLCSLAMTLAVLVGYALILPPFGFGGERMTMGPNGVHEIYVSGDVPRAKVERFVEALTEFGVASDEFGSITAVKHRDGDYSVSIPYEHGTWDDAELVAALVELKGILAETVFNGPVTIVLVDEDLKRSYRKEL